MKPNSNFKQATRLPKRFFYPNHQELTLFTLNKSYTSTG